MWPLWNRFRHFDFQLQCTYLPSLGRRIGRLLLGRSSPTLEGHVIIQQSPRTRQLTTLALFALIGIGVGFSGCSSGEDDVGNGDSEPQGNDDIDIGVGEGGAKNGSDAFSLKPGPLSADELAELRESSCTGWSFEPELQPSILQMIIDVSGSMNLQPPGGGNDSKWEITREALREAVRALPGTMSTGAVYFPNRDSGSNCTNPNNFGPCMPGAPRPVDRCVNLNTILDVQQLGAPDSPHRQAFENGLDDAEPNGGTPTHDAYNVAINELGRANLPGQRFALLITDGQPTYSEGCSGSGRTNDPVEEQPIIDAITRARENNVRTFVIGSPGSEQGKDTGVDARPWLSQAAQAGGTATDGCSDNGPNFCHFDMTQESDFGAALRQALAAIVGQIADCTINIPDAPSGQEVDPNQVNVILTPKEASAEVIGRDMSVECMNGWNYDSTGKAIELCEESCLQLRQDTSSGLELLFGCGTAPADPVK